MNREPDWDWTSVFILSNSLDRITFLQCCLSIRGAYVLLTSRLVVRIMFGSLSRTCCWGLGCCSVVDSRSRTEEESKLFRSR